MSYFTELTKAITWLGQQPDTVFIGQQVRYPGNALYKTLDGVPMDKRIEFPVVEDMQMGVSIGMAMMGKTVISIYPRMDFLMCAINQLVNHLDKNLYPLKGKVIIRTCIGSTKPLYPGVQHCGDYTEGLEKLLHNMPVFRLIDSGEIAFTYMQVYKGIWSGMADLGFGHDNHKAAVIIEEADLYGME